MKRRLIIYCDESDDKGKYYSHFYGGAAVDETKRDRIHNTLANTINSLNIQGEVKWTKIGHGHVGRYKSLMDVFFEYIKNREIKVRIMFMQNIYKPEDLEEYHMDNQYFLLYYQFIKHSFGLQYCNPNRDADTFIHLMLDELPEDNEKCELMKQYMTSLTDFPQFKSNRIVFQKEDISEINSKKHTIAQCLDVVLGAMQFRLNDKHLEKPRGQKRRGKRTIAKEKVYKHISKKIREVYPNFNIGISTGRPTDDCRWSHEYRHWNFKPANASINLKRSKKN